jgi:hypothetical protein
LLPDLSEIVPDFAIVTDLAEIMQNFAGHVRDLVGFSHVIP